jgi:thioredoxin-related protein
MNRAIENRRTVCLTAALIVTLGSSGVLAQQKDAAKPAKSPKRALIYDLSADADIQISKATERARRDGTRVLVMFGGDWCGWCHRLHNLFANDAEIRAVLANDYELVLVELEAPRAEALLKRCKDALSKEELQKGVGYPFLAVLDGSGKVVTAQRTDALEEGDHHEPKRVLAFLSKWALPRRDARTILNESLSRAASEDKKVFLTFTSPGCGWCHRLDEWFASSTVAPIIERDFVIARIDLDRTNNGKEVMLQYRTGSTGGVPWYAVLDAKGKLLTTADGPDGNIGYPLAPKEIDQFLGILKTQVQHIDDRQLNQLRAALVETAKTINEQQAK